MALFVDEEPLSSKDDAATFFDRAADAARLGMLKEAINFANLGTALLLRQEERAGNGPQVVVWPERKITQA
ncbi:MAG: hypothetical protein KBD50_01700 [Candidatus Pacebacteria bacterium]|nr:hypothetical protein [Candidatus Paceibacterota bacterium]